MSLQLVNSVRGRYPAGRPLKYGMTGLLNNVGFTLIELLVAVLIIGVLAAVALSQYKKTVLKSRFSKVMPVAKSVAAAQEVYYLGNSRYALSEDELDVESVGAENTEVALNSEEEKSKFNYVVAKRTDVPGIRYIMYQEHSPQFAGNVHCEADINNGDATWLCEKGLSGFPISGGLTPGYKTYILQGSKDDGYFGTVYTNTNNQNLKAGDKCVGTKSDACWKTYVPVDGTCEATESSYRGCGFSYFNGGTCVGNGSESCRTGVEGYHGYYRNDSTCEGNGNAACTQSVYNDSTCNGRGDNSCSKGGYRSYFSNDSTCNGVGTSSCTWGTFTNSTCNGKGNSACSVGTYNTSSICNGTGAGSCTGSTFSGGSKCYKNYSNACNNNTYNDTSCCVSNVAKGYICNDHECPSN